MVLSDLLSRQSMLIAIHMQIHSTCKVYYEVDII